MVWLVRALVVIAFALVGPILLAPNRQPQVMNVLYGLLTGSFCVLLSSLLGNLSRKISARHPIGAARAGVGFYGIGAAIAALCIGLASFAAFAGGPLEFVVVGGSGAFLYWAAGWGLHRALTDRRLPIERPAFALAPHASGSRPRQWKIALSFAIVGALVAPFAFGTYKARPTYPVWVPLTAQEKKNLAARFEDGDGCRREIGDVAKFICRYSEEQYQQGGKYEYHPNLLAYSALNTGVAVATFVGVFVLAFLIPAVVFGYWQWLNT